MLFRVDFVLAILLHGQHWDIRSIRIIEGIRVIIVRLSEGSFWTEREIIINVRSQELEVCPNCLVKCHGNGYLIPGVHPPVILGIRRLANRS